MPAPPSDTTGSVAVLPVPPRLTSVAAARRFVRDALDAWGLADLEADATLCASELVTNAVLHARTDVTVTVLRDGDCLRLAVHDLDTTRFPLPDPEVAPGRSANDAGLALSAEAMTGRGLRVVGQVARALELDVDDEGKTVSVLLGDCGAAVSAAALRSFTGGVGPSPDPEGTRIRLAAVPVVLALANATSVEDLLREVQLLALADGPSTSQVPEELLARFKTALEASAPQRLAGRRAAQLAAAAGQGAFDLEVTASPATVTAIEALNSLLDEISAYCDAGSFLTFAPTEELRSFRAWCGREAAAQIAGRPPPPYALS